MSTETIQLVCLPWIAIPCMPAEEWTALLTGVLALTTFLLMIVTWSLSNATTKLVNESSKTAEHQLKAYIGPALPTFFGSQSAGDKVAFSFVMKNFGQSQAHQIAVRTILVRSGDPEKEPLPTYYGVRNYGTLQPDQAINVIVDSTILVTQTDLEMVRTGLLRFVAMGEISYRDIFERQRTTHLRFFCDLDGLAHHASIGNDAN